MPSLVRGVLTVTVHHARNLPANETIQSKITGFFKQAVGKHKKVDHVGVYVNVLVGENRFASTSTFEHGDELNPIWEEHFRLDLASESDDITFVVMGDVLGPDKIVGQVKIDVEDVMNNPDNPEQWSLLSIEGNPPPGKRNGEYQMVNKHGVLIPDASLKLTLKFLSVETENKSVELIDSYFPERKNCNVTLYQDACTHQNYLHENIILGDGSPYKVTNAWKDVYEAIMNARSFIYITGWSVWTDVVLVREDGFPAVKLGDLLIEKANQGVTVLGLVWNEKASTGVMPSGLMGTHDEETANFFQDTNVHMVLVYRKKDNGAMGINELYSTCYSHHQKCVIVDAQHPADPLKRRLVSFIGGLDLTSGRYDSPDHSLFSTIDGLHKNDFYQNCVTVPATMGPRQPWHDIHSRVEGVLVIDALKNFEERWRKQAPLYLKGRLVNVTGDPRFDIYACRQPTGDQSWNCQLFRSITSDSVVFEASLFHRLTKKAKAPTEDSIHRAYIHQIRRAQKFIYIENQYFLGSAYAWKCKNKPKAHHLIPFELTEKITEKIEKNEDFHVYIVIPMFPEGDPSSQAIQEILHWQASTMRMMYTRISNAIRHYNRRKSPKDYLHFYFLGKRESQDLGHLPTPTLLGSMEVKLRKTRRFQIYVHSKMMIVDDSYVIIGSANINQRSMAGTRDTEIAVGSYQPNHMVDQGKLPKGNIYGFRLALWAEHLKEVEPAFDDPSSLECVRRVQELSEANWQAFTSKSLQDTPGFLMPYPINVSAHDGSLWPLPGFEKFPDMNAPVLGAQSNVLPDKLTC